MESFVSREGELNLKATELRLGLPGTDETENEIFPAARNKKRASPESLNDNGSSNCSSHANNNENRQASKAQLVGWPPVRSYRKNSLQMKKTESETGIYVKVSMDGAPYLRKIDLMVYKDYSELLRALENMFKVTIGKYSEREGYKGSDYAPTYEDKDGDWMLVGDVPWEMFLSSCNKMRIMNGSEAHGLGGAL